MNIERYLREIYTMDDTDMQCLHRETSTPPKWIDACIWTPTYISYSLMFPVLTSFLFGYVDSPLYMNITTPSVFGLSLGVISVLCGQVSTVVYYHIYNDISFTKPSSIEAIGKHFSQPEGFLLLGGYLGIYWMSGMMPYSYYQFSGRIQWTHVVYQLVIQDALQYMMHRMEHSIPLLYKYSHSTHHKHIVPNLYDAFDGSIVDTTCMILIPFFITSRIVSANIWSYMIFGTIYANMLTLIHSQYSHPWDKYARLFGIGTPDDHRLHHKKYKYNYGHIFMYWDLFCNTFLDS